MHKINPINIVPIISTVMSMTFGFTNTLYIKKSNLQQNNIGFQLNDIISLTLLILFGPVSFIVFKSMHKLLKMLFPPTLRKKH